MIILYFFCLASFIFNSHSSVTEFSEKYDGLVKSCKFPIKAKMPDSTLLIPQSNITCLETLVTSIDTAIDVITKYQNEYSNQKIHYLDRERIEKNLNDQITKVKLRTVQAKALFSIFDTVNFDIFDTINPNNDCKNDYCKNWLKQFDLKKFFTIKNEANQLLSIITSIQKHHNTHATNVDPDLDLEAYLNDLLNAAFNELKTNSQARQLYQEPKTPTAKTVSQPNQTPTAEPLRTNKYPKNKNNWWTDNRGKLLVGSCFLMFSFFVVVRYFENIFTNQANTQ